MITVLEYGNLYGGEPLVIKEFERRWLDALANEITNTSKYPVNLIINMTWINLDENLFRWVYTFGKPAETKLWFTATVDGLDYLSNSHALNYFKILGYSFSCVGFSEEHWNSWIPELLLKSNINQKEQDIKLRTVEKLYLSYNRKPREWRKNLVQSLIDNKLIDRGWVTFEAGHFSEIDNSTGESDQEIHSNDRRFTRPEDVSSLGNLDVWNKSYCVIVSETEITDRWQLSEKTWKPIMGLRPFMLNSNPDVVTVLKKLKIYTPSELFQNKDLDKCNVESIVNQLKMLYDKTPEELYDLYSQQFYMLNHNRNRFLEIANSDPSKILNWPQ